MKTISLLVLAGCAPPALGPPPLPFVAGQDTEIGGVLAGGGVVPRDESLGCHGLLGCAGASGGFYANYELHDRLEVGGMAFAGNTSLGGGGGFVRFWYLDSEVFRLGGELSAGWLWASVGVPVARRVGPVWLWTAPSAGLRYFSLLRLPVGVAAQPGEHLTLSGELSVGWDPWWLYQDPSTVFVSGAMSVGWRW